MHGNIVNAQLSLAFFHSQVPGDSFVVKTRLKFFKIGDMCFLIIFFLNWLYVLFDRFSLKLVIGAVDVTFYK